MRSWSFGLVLSLLACAATAAPAPAFFFPLTPCRALDTRAVDGTAGVPLTLGKLPLVSGVLRTARLEGACGIPDGAVAVSLNVTVVNVLNPGGQGNLTLWPAGAPFPVVSLLNTNGDVAEDYTVANHATVPLAKVASPTSDISIYFYGGTLGGSTDLIIDVDGYFGDALAWLKAHNGDFDGDTGCGDGGDHASDCGDSARHFRP
jgi:hypothetical protein